MRAVVQRVVAAEVRERPDNPVGGDEQEVLLGRIERGLCVLLGIGQGDDRADADWLADKIVGLRIFADAKDTADAKPMNRALSEVGGALLVISQFTLYADTSRGRRPSFTDALLPQAAEPLYEYFVDHLRKAGYQVATGRFGADMAVELINDGPVTLWLDSASAPFRSRAEAKK
jgi:D-tyrosyl-tRNA(Tyr) deacylase